MSNNHPSVLLLIKLSSAIAITALTVCQVSAQKRPKPTPTAAAGSQIETGASRTTPDQSTTANGGGKADKSNGLLQVQSGPGGGGSEPPGAGRITKIIITVVTGGDDLREGSAVCPFITTRDGKRIESNSPLNCQKKYPFFCQ